MNFLLRNLETNVEEETLLVGEQLLEEGAVTDLREVDRHLWVATVTDPSDEAPWEVEMKISPSRVLAGSCECLPFQKQGACSHFTAGLLALRRELNRRQEQKKTQKREVKNRPPKLTTAVVLENVEFAELVDFVKEYARRHRHFSIALKARFASNVEAIDSKEKFIQLLDSTINLARRPDRTITNRGLHNIEKVLGELRDQRDAAVSRGHFAEAVSIIQSILERLTPVLLKITSSPTILESELRHHVETWRRILRHPLAPALRQSIWDYLITEHSKLVYRKYGIDLLLFQLMLDMAQDTEQINELLTLLDEQSDKYLLEQRSPSPLLVLKWQLLEQAGRDRAALRLVEEHLPQPDLLLPAINLALRKQQNSLARRLAEAGLLATADPALKRALHDHLLAIAEREGDTLTLSNLLEERFLQTLDPTTYHRLREAFSGDWDQYRPALLRKIRQLPPSPQRLEILALLLSEEQEPHRLLDFLRETTSLDLLQRYDRHLIPDLQEEVLALYKQLLQTYVQDHLGPKSSRQIRETLDHLNNIGLRDLAARLVQEFRENYPERHTLMEELALF